MKASHIVLGIIIVIIILAVLGYIPYSVLSTIDKDSDKDADSDILDEEGRKEVSATLASQLKNKEVLNIKSTRNGLCSFQLVKEGLKEDYDVYFVNKKFDPESQALRFFAETQSFYKVSVNNENHKSIKVHNPSGKPYSAILKGKKSGIYYFPIPVDQDRSPPKFFKCVEDEGVRILEWKAIVGASSYRVFLYDYKGEIRSVEELDDTTLWYVIGNKEVVRAKLRADGNIKDEVMRESVIDF